MKSLPTTARILVAQLAILLTVGLFASSASARPGRALGRALEEVAEKLGRFGDDAALAVRKNLDITGGKAISAELAEYLSKNSETLPDVFRSRIAFQIANESPDLIVHLERASRRFPGTELARMLEELEPLRKSYPKQHRQLIEEVLPELGDREFVTLSRGLGGKSISSDTVEQALRFPNLANHSLLRGELFEQVAKRQIRRGALVPQGLRLKSGSEIVAGQKGRQGIDGIAVLEDGRPAILEFTLGKDLRKAKAVVDGQEVPQLSREWIRDRWKWILDDPVLVEELRYFGIDERFLDPKTFAKALEEAPRYFVTTKEGPRRIQQLARVQPKPGVLTL